MEDLQGLLEKINRDGVEKADAEAAKIVAAAEAKAKTLVEAATAEAAALRAAAEKDAADFAARAEATVRQAARDIVLGVRESISGLFERLLAQAVNRALGDEATVAKLAGDVIADMVGPGEIRVGENLVSALQAQLAAKGGFTVAADGSVGSGFTVRLDGGRIEHSFTGEVIAAELAKRLRPAVAALLK